MLFDLEYIKKVYTKYQENLGAIREKVDRPLTLAEKLLFAHFSSKDHIPERGKDYARFHPDRVAMQDATAQMALLQFINAGRSQTAVPATVHCDHLIQAAQGADADLREALKQNNEVYHFLKSVSQKYGIGFWEPGSGIIHQIVLENYAFPGGMLIGTDSHTVNAGGLGMMSIGVGGADAVDVMAGMPWELRMPKLIGVRLTGAMSGWTAPKDVILKLAGILTVKGATNAVVEYFGPGTESISCTGKATICNMGAEIGATTSVFPYDDTMYSYLEKTGRNEVAELAEGIKADLKKDDEVLKSPENHYDQIIEIDLSRLEPHVNGPYSPDAAVPISELAEVVRKNQYPERIDAAMVGSCTNSSYEDLTRSASIAQQAVDRNISAKTELLITPGSEQIKKTCERDGILQKFEQINGTIMANACGPCIGQWRRQMKDPDRKNSIINSYNRNFAKRNDGNPNTHSFVASPEIVTAMSLAGTLTFNPLKDELKDGKGNGFLLGEPHGAELPGEGYLQDDTGYIPPAEKPDRIEIEIRPDSQRLQLLEPFEPWDGKDLLNLQLLIKVKGKCTTDHISMAGPWLRYRGHLDNISDNLLMGAENSFNGKTNSVYNKLTGDYDKVSAVARQYKNNGLQSIIVGEENYGEGSSREHAAMEPRHLSVRAVLVKSFARIHETNLKKQGILALTFADKQDYDRIREDDTIDVLGMDSFMPGESLTIRLNHEDGTRETFPVNHSYSDQQIEWFKAGSALNLIAKQQKKRR
ncbi:MAG: aconitate hydratase [Bacteroidales bacterium]|nr:aconitate hydratase [Bacteroidales bacterium]